MPASFQQPCLTTVCLPQLSLFAQAHFDKEVREEWVLRACRYMLTSAPEHNLNSSVLTSPASRLTSDQITVKIWNNALYPPITIKMPFLPSLKPSVDYKHGEPFPWHKLQLDSDLLPKKI